VVVSAATGLARNGIAARDTIASIKKSLDGVMIFPSWASPPVDLPR